MQRSAWLGLTLLATSVPVWGAPRAAPGEAPGTLASFVAKRPGPETQVQKSARERGVNPCATPDPGLGAFSPWARGTTQGQVLVPRRLKGGAFDVVVHFHGHEAVRKEWVKATSSVVLVGVDLGLGSGPYAEAFAEPNAFTELLASVERVVTREVGAPSRIRHVGLSSWSAGYGAVGAILAQSRDAARVDAVALLDGLHSGYAGRSLNPQQLGPFVSFARRAARSERLLFVSHSSIIPPGYSSTTETAGYLIAAVGGKPRPGKPRAGDPLGLDLISWFSKGGFHVRGYAGNDTLDHCAQIGLTRDFVRLHLARRWR